MACKGLQGQPGLYKPVSKIDNAKGWAPLRGFLRSRWPCVYSVTVTQKEKTKQNPESVENGSSRTGLQAPLQTHGEASPEGDCAGEVQRGLSGGVRSNRSAEAVRRE